MHQRDWAASSLLYWADSLRIRAADPCRCWYRIHVTRSEDSTGESCVWCNLDLKLALYSASLGYDTWMIWVILRPIGRKDEWLINLLDYACIYKIIMLMLYRGKLFSHFYESHHPFYSYCHHRLSLCIYILGFQSAFLPTSN